MCNSGGDSDKCICEYIKERKRLIKQDKSCAVGGKIILNEREKIVNDYLMSLKNKEMDRGFAKPDRFLPAQHFFKARKKIEKSKIFQFIKAMPKGSSLHSHDLAMASPEFLYNVTFRPNLYARVKDETLIFHFYKKKKVPQGEDWTLVSELRDNDPEFDNFLKTKLTLIVEEPEKVYPDIDAAWTAFQNLFINLESLLTFKPVFQDYFYETLKEAYNENVKYVEFRGYLPNVYDLDGCEYREDSVVCLYWETLTQFMCDHTDFAGCKFIFAPHRLVDKAGMKEYIRIFHKIREKFPRFVIGFDLVGQEDKGAPLSNFLHQLLQMSECGAKFFFHAGETHWNGQATDNNLFDAILLGTCRIGHGFGLLKHPALAKMVKEKGIAIELAPISNQVLKLVEDIRSHPGSILIANNYPVVIVNDDPCWWGARGISYDWYVAFMGMAHRDADLRLLKQLAMNSIEYSGLDDDEKDMCRHQFKCDWNKFLTRVLKGCECGKCSDETC